MHIRENIFLFLVCIAYFNVFSQCPPPGEILLYSQSDVETFIQNYGSCEVINGDLWIGRDATDISGLTAIRRIEGSLRLNYSGVTSVSNFGSLEFVGGDFEIDQSHSLTSIEGINKLHTVNGDFLITGNYNNLKEIKGFDSLESVGGNFQISENYNGLEAISEFENLENIGGWFLVRANNVLEELVGFNELVKIGTQFSIESFKGNLSIESNRSLIEINGFNSLKEVVRNLEIQGNGSLSKIVGFSNLERINRILSIGGSLSLEEIPMFETLITIGSGIDIVRTGLSGLDGFNNVQVIGDLSPSWGNLHIRENPLLTEITGFGNLNKLEGGLGITQNDSLISLIGFTSLIEARHIGIGANPVLPNLNGLENIIKVEIVGGTAISIGGNHSLVDCSALCNLLTNGSIVGSVFISDNPSKCGSELKVREECIPDFDNDGVLNDDDLDDDNDGITDLVEQNGLPDRDSDEDGFPDHRDFDSDGDGCFDVIEAGFLDGDDNGTLGSAPDTVDVNGLIIGEPLGYTLPNDININGVFDFQEDNILDPGEDSQASICVNGGAVDLFTLLGGNPEIGGVWSPLLASGTGNFDPMVDPSGTYTYTVANGVCGSSSATLVLTVEQEPDAGEDGVLALCSNDFAMDLFTVLGGTPDSGGSWSPPMTSGTGVFDPTMDSPGTYTYTIDGASCTDDSAIVEVIVNQPPNPGEDSQASICVNGGAVDLFTLLGGNPEVGGVWSPLLASGTGNFDPMVDPSGTYTYTVANGVCGSNSTTLRIDVQEVFPITEFNLDITSWSGNNTVQLVIDSDRTYEYSLNNIDYQRSNSFDNLVGGMYFIYAREINGCGRLEETFTIVDYPRFFTPNNDGFNDVWELMGMKETVYTLEIFDRYGRFLKQLNNRDSYWDGTYRNKLLPASDYWFRISLENGEILTGHFSLIR